MSAENLGAIAGVVLSLLFSYIPGLSDWFAGLDKGNKQALMGVLLVLVAAGVFGLNCAHLFDFGLACSTAGAVDFVQVLIAALVANQGMYLITKK